MIFFFYKVVNFLLNHTHKSIIMIVFVLVSNIPNGWNEIYISTKYVKY